MSKRGQARGKVISAALALFAEHGVSGTSLQMIADKIGVTKAAVYFQFRTKDEIVFAVLEPAMDSLEGIVSNARGIASRSDQLDYLVTSLVDLVVDNRQISSLLERDPALAGLMQSNPRWLGITLDLGELLRGKKAGVEARVAVSLVAGGLMMTGADPTLIDLSDDELRRALKRAMRKLLALYE